MDPVVSLSGVAGVRAVVGEGELTVDSVGFGFSVEMSVVMGLGAVVTLLGFVVG